MTSLLVRLARRIPLLPRALDAVAPGRSAAAVTRQNTREAYDKVYESDRLLSEYITTERLQFYDELVGHLAPIEARRIVDVGCGTGHLLRLLVDRLSIAPDLVVGIDHAEAGIRRARELMPGGTWIAEDLYSWSADAETFDLVLCTEVLEHLAEPGRAVDTLCALCAPGGRVVITVPDGAADSWDGHVNFWDEDALAAFLAASGLVRVERVDGGRTLLAWLAPPSTSESP
jgi:2-polyprenyl-3-methyl-5-hydroxy-6-metoxy-1,4-benzoquinol methylase